MHEERVSLIGKIKKVQNHCLALSGISAGMASSCEEVGNHLGASGMGRSMLGLVWQGLGLKVMVMYNVPLSGTLAPSLAVLPRRSPLRRGGG